jgi:hypothetical protein
MGFGSVLLQPRKVALPAAPPAAVLLEDVLALGVRLLWDQAHDGVCGARLQAALEIAFTRISDHMKSGQAAALAKVQAWMKPFVDRLAGVGKTQGALDAGDKLLALIVQLLDGVTTDELAKHLEFVLKVVHDDLGITNTFIDDQVTAILDEMVAQLRSAPPEADLAARENRLEIIALIRRIRREIDGTFTMPPINVDRLAGPALAKLREVQYDAFVKNVATIGTSARSGLGLTGVFADTLPFSLGFGGGVGAAAAVGGGEKRAWYASWVEGADSITAPDPAAAPELAKYSFKHTDAATMEQLTLHSKWITTLIDGILLAIIGYGKGRGVYSITTVSVVRDAVYTLAAPLADFEFPWWADLIFNAVATALCALEGRALNRFDALLYLFRFLFRFGGTSLPVDKVRDAILSIATLHNHDTAVTPTPLNRNNGGLTRFVMEILGPLLHAGIMPANYFSINGEYGALIGAVLGGALGISLLSFGVGFIISVGLAGEPPEAKEGALIWLKGWAKSHLTFIGFWFLFNDGKTNGGKRGDKADAAAPRGLEVEFEGYQPAASSPYLLPFAGAAECVQGNHGFWSHNSIISQTFSYDFSLSIGQDILCMRAGEVVKILDTVDDGEHPSDGNHIVIKHTTPNADHDKTEGGSATTTYAEYYHSQKGSIAAAGLSVGDAVTQGQKLATCNSTGMSRFNHIHVQVNPERTPGVLDGRLTIPFVFKDAADDGVPKSQTVYDSENVKTP